MTSPAEELVAAADKLEALIAGATDGPWVVERQTIASSGVDRLQVRGAHKSWPSGRTSATTVTSGIDEETAGPDDSEYWLGSGDAAYIAAMNPPVGKALAAALRIEGETVAGWDPALASSHAVNLLPIARLING